MKYLFSSLLSIFVSLSAFAQNSAGVDYFGLGEYKLAKDAFQKQVNQSPAEANYYLGEIALKEGNAAEAKSFYQKGLAAQPEDALNNIGLAKLDLKSNPKEAKNVLSEIAKKNKKDVKVLVEIARAYFENGMTAEMTKTLEDARKADKKSPWIYLFEGDMLASQNKMGDAAAQYDQAWNFDSNCIIAYVKSAKVYETINAPMATDMLKKVTTLKPDYLVTYKYLGDIYSNSGFFPEASEAYKKYFAGGDYSVDDIKSYAGVEYYAKNYDKVKSLAEEGLKREPNNFILNRLLMYSDNELKNYQGGLLAAEKYFSLPKAADVNYIVQDYTNYADILKNLGQLNKAIAEYEKAIKLDPTKVGIYKDIASTLASEDKLIEAADLYKKYIELHGDGAQASDYYQLGRYYYSAATNAQKDPENAELMAKAEQYLKEADIAFGTVSERIGDSPLGPLWRARANALLDPNTDKGLAKPYYEEVVKRIEAKGESDESSNNQEKEALRYLSYFYYLQWDATKDATAKASAKDSVIINADKLLQLDPANDTAIKLKEAVQ